MLKLLYNEHSFANVYDVIHYMFALINSPIVNYIYNIINSQ